MLARGILPVFVRDEQRFELGRLDGQDLRERRSSGLQEITHPRGPLLEPGWVEDRNDALQARVAGEGGTPYLGLLYGATFDSSQGAFTPPAV